MECISSPAFAGFAAASGPSRNRGALVEAPA
jgi:hypothetical protein